jgi:hypothetical protein
MLLAVVFLWLSASASPVDAAYAFLHALDRRDAKALGKLTLVQKASPPAQKQWQDLLAHKLKAFRFTAKTPPEEVDRRGNEAVVKVTIISSPTGYRREDDIQVFLVLVDGKWLVDTGRMARTIFTDLPY